MTIKNILDKFEKKIDSRNYKRSIEGMVLEEPNDSLLNSHAYPESQFELDEEKIKHFLQENITELLEGLKMKEKDELLDKTETEIWWLYGYNSAKEELNNKIKEING